MSLSRYLSKLGALLNSSGQVPAAGLADGAVTATKVAAGTTIQTVTGVSTTEVSLGSSANVWYDAFSVSLTTKRANSTVLLDAVVGVDRSSGNYPAIGVRIHAYKNGVSQGILNDIQYYEYEGSVQEHHIGRAPIQAWHTIQTAGETWTYYIQARNMSGSTPSGTYSGYANRYGTSTVVVTEVAG